MAREAGIARYERIADFDWSAGDEYWKRTGPFWAEVRSSWTSILGSRSTYRLETPPGEPSLYQVMFSLAEDPKAGRAEIDEVLGRYATTP